ncbi:MAG: GntR family transcriptional regulator [Planctomycetales bacterium]|nr:GntR family transcriptional regulator [Planctomycetales bacterium]
MLFHIQSSNGLAIYDQVVRQIKFAVANRAVQAGELVPSVRELAKQLAINPNTVSRAYRQLQDEGVLESVRGMGMQVTARALDQCRQARLELIRARLQDVLEEARQSGLSGDDIRRLVDESLA